MEFLKTLDRDGEFWVVQKRNSGEMESKVYLFMGRYGNFVEFVNELIVAGTAVAGNNII